MDSFNLLGSGTQTLPSALTDPFNKISVKSISIHMRIPIFAKKGEVEWYSRISFENGSTEGTQKFDGYETFDELMAQMRIFMNQLK